MAGKIYELKTDVPIAKKKKIYFFLSFILSGECYPSAQR